MSSIKRFLEGMGEGYYSLPPAERRATEIMGWVNLVLAAGVVWYMVYDHRKRKRYEIVLEEESKQREAEVEKKMVAVNAKMEQWQSASREKMKEIVDRALNPSESDLEDLRKKLDDPNYVWEL